MANTNEKAKEEKAEKKKVNRLKMLEEALSIDYLFRYNTITGIPEFQHLDEEGEEWHRMDDYQLNSLVRELRLNGISWASRAKIGELMESDFSGAINPIEQYFKQLPKPGKKDHIGDLARTVSPVCDPKMWRRYFEKWLVAAVANVFVKDRCANHTMLILTGSQGSFKSTWIRNLCPEALYRYYVEDRLDPDNKDHLLATTANFIYNLDDTLSYVTKKDANTLKDFITKPRVKARRPYSRYAEDLSKICSFAGTTNDEAFLYDTTGSRRFLPFPVQAIDIKAAQELDIDLVWSQAYQLFRKGFQYWLSKDEEAEINKHNEQFQVQSPEYELVATWYRVPRAFDQAEVYLSNTEIINELETKTKRPISGKRIGEALTQLGYERKQQRMDGGSRKWVYGLERIGEEEAFNNRVRKPKREHVNGHSSETAQIPVGADELGPEWD